MKLIDVAKDTISYCKKDKKNSDSIFLKDLVYTKEGEATDPINISVINNDYVSLAYECAKEYSKVAILNMCSDLKPGGGFLNGRTAGEEELCRRSTLYPQLLNFRYPFDEPLLIYAKSIEIFKSAMTYKRIKPTVEVDVISIAAIKRPAINSDGDYVNQYQKNDMEIRIRSIAQVAHDNGIECLVLSAFGCGVYQNPSRIVAEIFKDVLNGYQFKRVMFGILDDTVRGRDTNNFDIFTNVFTI